MHSDESLTDQAAEYLGKKVLEEGERKKEALKENVEKMVVENMRDFAIAFRQNHPEWQTWWDQMNPKEQEAVLFGTWADALLKMTVFGIVKIPSELRGSFTRALILMGAIQADESTIQAIESKGSFKASVAETFTKYVSVALPELEPLAIAAHVNHLMSGKGREYAEECRNLVKFHDSEVATAGIEATPIPLTPEPEENEAA